MVLVEYNKEYPQHFLKIKEEILAKVGPENRAGYVLFTVLLGLAGSAAVFAFVQFIITGNLLVGGILLVFSLTAWAFNYPSDMKEDEQ